MAPQEPVNLDGRTLEGGGQLLRLAVCLSSLTGIPVKITNIRGNRSSGGGLKAQHLACVNWLAHAGAATVSGAEKGSKSIHFEPNASRGGFSPAYKKRKLADGKTIFECIVDIGTAGSTGLALQAVLPFLLFAPPLLDDNDDHGPDQPHIRLTIRGGTNVSGSPSFEYINQVLLPTLKRLGFPTIVGKLERRGWSHGGSSIGSFSLEIPSRRNLTLPAFHMWPEDVDTAPTKPSIIRATFIGPASCHRHLREVLVPAIHHYFGKRYSEFKSNLSIECEDSRHDKRLYLILVATTPTSSTSPGSSEPGGEYTLGRDWLYDRKIRSVERSTTEMAERVALDLFGEWESGTYVDEHMRDQLVVFEALAKGRSRIWSGKTRDGEEREPSLHARTAEWVARQMLDVRFDAEGSCDGVAFGECHRPDIVDEAAAGGWSESLQHLRLH